MLLKPNDYEALFDLCDQLRTLRTPEQFHQHTQTFVDHAGLKEFLFASLPTFATQQTLNKLPEGIGTFDESWIQYYGEKQYYRYDVPLHNALSGSTETFVWPKHDLRFKALPKQSLKVALEATEAGVGVGATIPLHNSFGAISTFSLSFDGSHDGFTQFYSGFKNTAEVFAYSLSEHALSTHPDFYAQPYRPNLTDKEIETLHWLAHGYTYDQTAYKMTIGASTIRKHTAKIFAKLKANNIAHATALAVKWRIIK